MTEYLVVLRQTMVLPLTNTLFLSTDLIPESGFYQFGVDLLHDNPSLCIPVSLAV